MMFNLDLSLMDEPKDKESDIKADDFDIKEYLGPEGDIAYTKGKAVTHQETREELEAKAKLHGGKLSADGYIYYPIEEMASFIDNAERDIRYTYKGNTWVYSGDYENSRLYRAVKVRFPNCTYKSIHEAVKSIGTRWQERFKGLYFTSMTRDRKSPNDIDNLSSKS